jgi:hypothetical protein
MFKLRDSDRFKKEYDAYKKAIDSITIESSRERGQQLLSQLQNLCVVVEQAHDTQSHPVIDPRNTRDTIIKMIGVRKELAQIVKDVNR